MVYLLHRNVAGEEGSAEVDEDKMGDIYFGELGEAKRGDIFFAEVGEDTVVT